MSKPKHTPGPWGVESMTIQSPSADIWVASLQESKTKAEMKANALEAMKLTRKYLVAELDFSE